MKSLNTKTRSKRSSGERASGSVVAAYAASPTPCDLARTPGDATAMEPDVERLIEHEPLCGGMDDLPEVPDGFRIDDEAKASWAVRKIVEARAYGTRVQEWARRESARAERDEQWLLRRFGPELEAWLRAELERRGGRRRSVALPAGTLGVRLQPARLQVWDEPAAVAWCERQLPEALRVIVEASGADGRELARWQRQHSDETGVRVQVMREPLGRHFAESGELPEGTTLVPAEDRLFVK